MVVCYEKVTERIETILNNIKSYNSLDEKYNEKFIAYEAAGASAYWSYVRQLLADDEIDFETRERKGATDLFNSLLNYGYALLYSRVWQAVLAAKLNPAISVLHAPQLHKPTLVYDLTELFRAQAVYRIVIGLIQKGEPLSLEKNLLEENTKKLLIRNVLERFNRYENFRGTEMKFIDIIRHQAKEWTNYIQEKSKSFKPYIAKW